jgi:hypothetical protein
MANLVVLHCSMTGARRSIRSAFQEDERSLILTVELSEAT